MSVTFGKKLCKTCMAIQEDVGLRIGDHFSSDKFLSATTGSWCFANVATQFVETSSVM
jgi:hypothetical protein